jgi:hypothetical protein
MAIALVAEQPPPPRPLSPRGRGEVETGSTCPSPPWGRGRTAAGVLFSRGGPGEGVSIREWDGYKSSHGIYDANANKAGRSRQD